MILFVFGLWLGVLATVSGAASDSNVETNVLSLAELRNAVSKQGRSIQSFQIDGTVCAVDCGHNLLAIQDGSAGVVLEIPALDDAIRAGDVVRVTANHCAVTRTRYGLQLGTAPVVNNDGHHGNVIKSGKVFLQAGYQPIRVTWFNGCNVSTLKVEYEGPTVPRQVIPATALFRKVKGASSSADDFQPGLDFAAYTGNWVYSLPDFQSLTPVAHGVAKNFDLLHSVGSENTGLVFTGYLNIATTGIYNFHVESDDGADLYAGNAVDSCRIEVLEHKAPPVPRRFAEELLGLEDNQWTELEREVVFIGQHDQDVELELAGKGGDRIQAIVVKGPLLLSTNLLHRRVRATGMLEALPEAEMNQKARLIVPGPSQIGILESAKTTAPLEPSNASIIQSIERIRHLTRNEAMRGLPVKVKGVVIWNSHFACVLDDGTGGVYIEYVADDWMEEPMVGGLWEIEGTTDPGSFSPVIKAQKATFLGNASMPVPIRPTWDQWLNGSLDAEYVELRGVLTKVSEQEMTVLTSEGKITISQQDDHSLPVLPSVPTNRSFVDSIVRIRGCVMTRVFKSHLDAAGNLHISPATVEIEEMAPLEPFALPTRSIGDLLRFDPGAGVLQRAKIKGQIVFGRAGEYCLQDKDSGLRLLMKEPAQLQPGDEVEAVGFPQLGGPSPLLQEARVKVVGNLPLPAPIRLSVSDLLNHNHDSTLVQVEAVLLDDRVERDQRVMELQAGQYHFTARLNVGQARMALLETGSRLLVTGVYYSMSGVQPGGSLDGFQLWMSSPRSITVLQKPPWWTEGRAITIVAALTALVCLALGWITVLRRKVEERTAQLKVQIEERQRVEQRRVMEHERTRVAQDLHDELGASLTEMGLLGDLVKNPAVPAMEKEGYLGQLTNTARSLVSSLDEIVWAVNPQYDSVASLVSYYILFAQRFLDLAKVACRPQIPSTFPEYPLDSKERHGMFLAFREALNNVVRHSGASEVRLKINIVKGELIIVVADNGHGFESVPEAPGMDGLKSMRQRMEHLGGICEIRSRRGNGTEVELRLPIERNVPCR